MKPWRRSFRLVGDLVVALVVISATVGLYRFGVMALLEALFPLTEIHLTILRRVGVIASLFVSYWAVARYHERRRITELAFEPVAISVSALVGVALIGLTILSLYALENYRWLSFRGLSAGLPIGTAILFAVVLEEFVFRGVIFRLLERDVGTVNALVAQALVFGGLHLFNDGTTAMTMISVTLLGAFWATIYVYTRNLWVVIANHVAWNVTIFAFGLPLSGQETWRAAAPFESSSEGPAWLTGGRFGPEDSIINILVMAGALAGLAYWSWRQGRFVRGSWIEPKPEGSMGRALSRRA